MRHHKTTVVYLCNAVDSSTKKERSVRFDSPAATNKVFGIIKALRSQNVNAFVLSLGRGRQTGSRQRFPAVAKWTSGLPVLYAAFWHYPLVTHVVGALSMAILFVRLMRGRQGRVAVIAYNRLWHYLPTLVLAVLFRARCYLDLEDGAIESAQGLTHIGNVISKKLFDTLCRDGALTAAKALKAQLKTGRIFVCYGCATVASGTRTDWDAKPMQILFGGSLLAETGVSLLMDAINLLEQQAPYLKSRLKILVTGHGVMAGQLAQFSKSDGKGWIRYFGEVDHGEYMHLLKQAHVGLCLKLPSAEMGKTTFPSKIIEYASHGLLIVSTQVSDVPDLLDDNSAILLSDETPQSLVQAFTRLTDDVHAAQLLARRGSERIRSVCSYESVGRELKDFLFNGY